jgi:ribonuclease P protein component
MVFWYAQLQGLDQKYSSPVDVKVGPNSPLKKLARAFFVGILERGMLAKQQRLSRPQFNHHFKIGTRFHSPTSTLIVSPHPTFHGAVVVSKKVSKKAVERNTLRRRAYAQLYQAALHKNGGVYILILKPSIRVLSRTKQHQAIADVIALAT